MVKLEDIIMDVMDPQYFKDAEAIIHDDDDSTLSVRFNMIKAIPITGQVSEFPYRLNCRLNKKHFNKNKNNEN